MTEIEKARAQAFVDAVDVVKKYFQKELDKVTEIIDDEAAYLVQCSKIIRYSKDICTALKRKEKEVKQ